jgi:hypothetical protein
VRASLSSLILFFRCNCGYFFILFPLGIVLHATHSLLGPGSEPAALDEEKEENWKTAVDASPTEVPSPTTGTTGTGQAPTESHGTLEAQQEATEASTSDLPKEESQIPQSTSGEAKGQFQASDENADGAVI